MPISNETSKLGIVLSARELALLSRAFDTACQQCLDNNSPLDTEALAEEIVAAYQRGVRGEDELVKNALLSTVRRSN
jgi:hypothetical protein